MSKKEKQKTTKKGLTTANLLSILAVFVLIPLLMGMILPKKFEKPPDNNELEENDSLENSTEKEDSKNEGLIVNLTGFKDYKFPLERKSNYNFSDHGVVMEFLDGVSTHEVIEETGNKFLEFSATTHIEANNSYINFLVPATPIKHTQETNGVVISFDIAMDRLKALDRFQLVLRDENSSPIGANIPYNKIELPNKFGIWQHVVLDYNFRDNTCDVYIDGVKTSYSNVFSSAYDPSDNYSIACFRALYGHVHDYTRTFIDNFDMEYYVDFSEEIVNSFENRSGEILDIPIAYVDGVAYYNYEYLQDSLTGNSVKDIVIVTPYNCDASAKITISCPVRIKNYSPMKLEFSSNLECIGELEGVYFYDFVKEK